MTVRQLRQMLFDIEEQDEEITLEELKKMMEEHETKLIKKRRIGSSHYCIFEKKICRYANNNNGAFICEAPSDDDMICR